MFHAFLACLLSCFDFALVFFRPKSSRYCLYWKHKGLCWRSQPTSDHRRTAQQRKNPKRFTLPSISQSSKVLHRLKKEQPLYDFQNRKKCPHTNKKAYYTSLLRQTLSPSDTNRLLPSQQAPCSSFKISGCCFSSVLARSVQCCRKPCILKVTCKGVLASVLAKAIHFWHSTNSNTLQPTQTISTKCLFL